MRLNISNGSSALRSAMVVYNQQLRFCLLDIALRLDGTNSCLLGAYRLGIVVQRILVTK